MQIARLLVDLLFCASFVSAVQAERDGDYKWMGSYLGSENWENRF